MDHRAGAGRHARRHRRPAGCGDPQGAGRSRDPSQGGGARLRGDDRVACGAARVHGRRARQMEEGDRRRRGESGVTRIPHDEPED